MTKLKLKMYSSIALSEGVRLCGWHQRGILESWTHYSGHLSADVGPHLRCRGRT